MKSAFDKIAAGLNDAIAHASGDNTRARIANVDVKRVRSVTGKTQAVFATTYRIPAGTLKDWEQGRREPDTGSRVYLKMIEVDPAGVEKILAKIG